MRWIERRETPEGPRYRYWCSIVDCYLCEPVEREVIAEMLLVGRFLDRHGTTTAEVEERLARTDARGTSAMWFGPIDTSEPWSTSRCMKCGDFHHAFVGTDGPCSACGEPRENDGHAPPCSS